MLLLFILAIVGLSDRGNPHETGVDFHVHASGSLVKKHVQPSDQPRSLPSHAQASDATDSDGRKVVTANAHESLAEPKRPEPFGTEASKDEPAGVQPTGPTHVLVTTAAREGGNGKQQHVLWSIPPDETEEEVSDPHSPSKTDDSTPEDTSITTPGKEPAADSSQQDGSSQVAKKSSRCANCAPSPKVLHERDKKEGAKKVHDEDKKTSTQDASAVPSPSAMPKKIVKLDDDDDDDELPQNYWEWQYPEPMPRGEMMDTQLYANKDSATPSKGEKKGDAKGPVAGKQKAADKQPQHTSTDHEADEAEKVHELAPNVVLEDSGS